MKEQRITFRDLTKPLTVPQYSALSIFAPIFFMYFTWPSSFEQLRSFFLAFSWYSIVGITQGLGHSYIGIRLDRVLPWEKSPIKRLFATIIGIVAYAALAYAIVGFFLAYFWFPISPNKAFQMALLGTKIAIIISFAFAFVFASLSFFLNWQKSKLEAERLEKELANYRYTTLKNQINPHFLFNSLNVLTDLVHEDADLSEKYIHQLSKIYRYVLASANHRTVTLHEELDFVASYAFLLKIRFGEKIQIHLNIKANPDDYVIPVSIQMLMENSIKHNQVVSDSPLRIDLKKEGHHIVVQNNIQPKISLQDSSGTGLNNLRQQYQSLTKDTLKVKDDGQYFSVSLPILESPKDHK